MDLIPCPHATGIYDCLASSGCRVDQGTAIVEVLSDIIPDFYNLTPNICGFRGGLPYLTILLYFSLPHTCSITFISGY